MSKSFHLNKIGCYPFLHDVYRRTLNIQTFKSVYPQIRSESVCSNQFNCYACVRHQIEANDALVMPL